MENRFLHFKIFILLFFIFLFLVSCGENDEISKKFSSHKIQGQWKISNIEKGEILDFDSKPGFAILRKPNGSEIEEYVLLDDGVGIRVQKVTSSQPEGYFLWSDRKGNSWVGIWREDLTRLILLSDTDRADIFQNSF